MKVRSHRYSIFLFMALSVSFSMKHKLTAQNVGIGTSNPMEKLHVAGTIRADALAALDTNIVLFDINGKMINLVNGNSGDVLRIQGNHPRWDSMFVYQSSDTTISFVTNNIRNTWVPGNVQLTVNQSGNYKIDWIARLHAIWEATDQWWKHRLYNATTNQNLGTFFGFTKGPNSTLNGDLSSPGSIIRHLNAGDVIRIEYFVTGMGVNPYRIGDGNGATVINLLRIGN